MNEIFLNTISLGKLNILRNLLFTDKGLFLKDIILHNDLSRSTCIRYLNELTDDLLSIFPELEISIRKSIDSDQYLLLNPKMIAIDYIIDTVRLYYIQQSILYPIILKIMTKNYTSVNQLALELNMSRSTLYASLKKLNNVLKIFNCRITLQKGNSNFEGDEMGTRFAIYFFLWSIWRTKKIQGLLHYIPSSLTELKSLKDSLNLQGLLPLSKNTKLEIIQSVSLYRIIYLKKFIFLPDSFYKDAEFLFDSNLHFESSLESKIPSTRLYKEKFFICFALRGLVYDLYPYEEKEAVVTKYLNSNLYISIRLNQFIDNFKDKYNIQFTRTSYTETYYVLLLALLYGKYIEIDFIDYFEYAPFLKRFRQNNSDYVSLESSLVQFVNSQNILADLKVNREQDFSKQIAHLLLWSFYLTKKTKPINISIQISNNIYLGDVIKKVIAEFIPPHKYIITDDLSKTDLLVSDTYEGSLPLVDKYYIHNPYEPETWTELIAFINRKNWDSTYEL